MCVRVFSVLCCLVQVETLRRADPPSKESYQISPGIITSNLILNRNRPIGIIRERLRNVEEISVHRYL